MHVSFVLERQWVLMTQQLELKQMTYLHLPILVEPADLTVGRPVSQ
jgi:hypothetical protein